MQLTNLLVCLMTMAPVVIHAIPIRSNDLSLDAADIDVLFPEEELNLVKRAVTKPAKPVAKPTAKPLPVVAKPAVKPVAVKVPVKAPIAPVKAPAKAPVTQVKAPGKGAIAPVKAPAKPPTATTAPVKPPTATSGGKLGQATTAPGASTGDCAGVVEKRNNRLGKRVAPCECFKKCTPCTTNMNCAFSTVTFTCVTKPGAATPPDSIVKATAAQRCPAVQQQAAIFREIQGDKGVAAIPAGLPPAKIQALFTQIKPHVFTRESPQRPDAGQHLKSAWLANHPTGKKSVATCNPTTGLCTFVDGSATGKTVWNDDAGVYSKQDVTNMCSVALELADRSRTGSQTRHVILTPLNVKICVDAIKQFSSFDSATGAGQGTCFPVGREAATGVVHFPC